MFEIEIYTPNGDTLCFTDIYQYELPENSMCPWINLYDKDGDLVHIIAADKILNMNIERVEDPEDEEENETSGLPVTHTPDGRIIVQVDGKNYPLENSIISNPFDDAWKDWRP